ncbi:Spc98 family-domain-containing protein [Dichotomocladium elegans]|nr:Spc98 family-domain-containing protein [Dichotomocladium elegans]
MRHIIPVPQTIFDDIKANPSPERWSEQSMSSTINKTFLQAGFPLFHPPRMEIPDESPRELSITSWLFDEALRQVLEDYVNEPYIQATQKLRNVLWESCTFGLHLGAISSIFLMLEDELMHVFCESLFHEMDEAIYAESSGTNAQIDKLFMDAKIAVGGVHADLTYSTCYFDYHADGSFLDKIRFRYTLPWPLNTYIRSSTFQGYTAIATLLLRLKRTKHLLDRKTFTQERRGMRLHAMRVRMIWFVNAFWSYIMTTILYTETRAFCAAIQKLENVEDITEMHESYMSRIVDRCLLGDMTRAVYTSVLRILDQVQELAQMFVQENTEHENYFDEAMKAMENDFSRDTEFISVSLGIIAKKGGFPWCKLSSISLTAGLLSTS